MKVFISLFLFSLVLTTGVKGDSKLFCLQCTWSNTNYYSSNNGTSANSNATSDDMCDVVDLENTIVFPKPRVNPLVNPMCTYPVDYDAYARLLQGPCYDYACYAQGRKCVKWSNYKGSILLSVARLCAVTDEVGCFSQASSAGMTTEVCICDDQQFCNGAVVVTFRHQMFLLIFLLIWWWKDYF